MKQVILIIVGLLALCVIALENKTEEGPFMNADQIEKMPGAIKRFFRYAKFDPARPMNSVVLHSTDVNFQMDINFKRYKIIHYHQRSTATIERSIDMRVMMYRIFPFDVADRYLQGKRRVKGTFAKVFPTFDVQGEGFDSYSLHAFVAEAAYMPAVFLLSNMTLSEVGNDKVKAEIAFRGTKATVLFTVDEVGRLVSAEVEKMFRVRKDQSELYEPWSMKYAEWEGREGHMVPTHFAATYHSDGYDLVEYEGYIHDVFYNQ